jgi:glycosyltransferase involved in cell wall biosynthesis
VTPTVLSVAFPFAPVSPDPVGGAEQVLSRLDEALVARGWRSIVLACDGSRRVAGELVTVPAVSGEIDAFARACVQARVRAALDDLLRRERIDLVHLHGLDFDRYLPRADVPMLVTLHLPLDYYEPAALAPERPRTWLVPVSADQARRAPASARLLEPVGLGVDTGAFPRLSKRGYALSLGRVCPEKGIEVALDAAARAGAAMLVAGAVFPYAEHRRYFERELASRFDLRRRWIGPVAGARKRRLIAGARCLVVASLAPETACLVAMEALAAGTPVVAFPNGALAEVVEDGVTGFLVEDVEGMARAIAEAGRLDPEACRAAARRRFPLARMTGAYLDLYQRLIAQGRQEGARQEGRQVARA